MPKKLIAAADEADRVPKKLIRAADEADRVPKKLIRAADEGDRHAGPRRHFCQAEPRLATI